MINASESSPAALCGGLATALLRIAVAALAGCTAQHTPQVTPRIHTAQPVSGSEDYCAWYGDARDGVLYFGQAAFWAAKRAHAGDPRGDLAAPGPQLIGRFDLQRERMLPPLDVTAPGARSGVWDVHAHRNGRVYYTTFFEEMGAVDPATGDVSRFRGLGLGLNEIAAGEGDTLLVTRYGAGPREDPQQGSLLVISPEGVLLEEHALTPPAGYTAAPKTPALDTASATYWLTADLLPRGAGAVRNDAFVLSLDGVQRRRIETPEIQFVASNPQVGLLRAERSGSELDLVRPVGSVVLDTDFAAAFDFTQDVKPTPDGGAVVTQWSGLVHRVAADGSSSRLQLPNLQQGGLYYTAVLADDRICATYCAGVRVVCTRIP
ncbi:MAG TPA: hypothetical protein QF557_08675 [Myxococcota bacterium]|nr:hypothetical protein [Myxococcota bacterium]